MCGPCVPHALACSRCVRASNGLPRGLSLVSEGGGKRRKGGKRQIFSLSFFPSLIFPLTHISVAPKEVQDRRLDTLKGRRVDKDLNQHQKEDAALPAKRHHVSTLQGPRRGATGLAIAATTHGRPGAATVGITVGIRERRTQVPVKMRRSKRGFSSDLSALGSYFAPWLIPGSLLS